MLITVAICTLNRAESLRCTLDSLAVMRVPAGLDWEVVVVNNNGTDHTDAVIAAFADRLPIRREFEPQRGLSRARNRAVEAAKGDYIVWTDDDVIVDPGWLAAYADAFRLWPKAAVFGGPITPRHTAPAPRWIAETEALLGSPVFAARDIGRMARQISEDYVPLGPNFALRAVEQRAFRYNLMLGHAPGQRRRGEETDVVRRILRSGAVGCWVLAARAEHCSTPRQQTLSYTAECFATAGETEAYLRGDQGAPLWFGAPRWAWRQLVEGWLRYRFHRLLSPASVWMPHLVAYASARGVIRGRRRTEQPQVARSPAEPAAEG